MRHFTLTITLGNDAMQTSNDVAGALQEVAEVIGGHVAADGSTFFDYVNTGKIRDANGNTVGTWEVAE